MTFKHWVSVGIAVLACTQARAQTTERVSVATGGAQADNDCFAPSISADGRFVVFWGTAMNFAGVDPNGYVDVFARDRTSGTTEWISVSSGGVPGNSHSRHGSISADGRYVAFESSASNLVAGDSNGYWDIFVRDRTSGTTTRVSVDSSGAAGIDGNSELPAISPDGRFVAFESLATNLVAGDTNGQPDIFVHDRTTGATERVSVSSGGVQGNSASHNAVISTGGGFVAFESYASNLVGGDTNAVPDVFVRNRLGAVTERVSISGTGAQGNGTSLAPSISADGRYVAFRSSAQALVVGDTNGSYDVFVRDRQNAGTERVSVSSAGVQGNMVSGVSGLAISADGRYVTYNSNATNLVAGDTNGFSDIFVRDRNGGTTVRASVDSLGAQGNTNSSDPAISADGRCVAFQSYATNLVAGDTNGFADVFVRDRGWLYPGAYCTAGTTSSGCIASISASGSPSASSGSGFTLSVSAVEGQKQGLLFYGLDNTGFAPAPWGGSTSYLCIKSPTQRTPAQSSGGTAGACNGALAIDWNLFRASTPGALGSPFAAGQHVFAQGWFRDPPSPKTTSLSNAIEFVVGP
jgi:Tol biopolymer transport system component